MLNKKGKKKSNKHFLEMYWSEGKTIQFLIIKS